VGTAAPSGNPQTLLSAADYISMVLKPAVDYATSKKLYVIIDFHQIDNVTTGTNNSSAAAVSFWGYVAPVFSTYPNVIYEAFNEPIDSTLNGWDTAFQTAAQSWVNAIRGTTSQPVAPNNLIVVGSPSWSQHPEGAITYPLTGEIWFSPRTSIRATTGQRECVPGQHHDSHRSSPGVHVRMGI
jgi:aryl-phospho-beta-D-glucosidase BglC (GH1 family)